MVKIKESIEIKRRKLEEWVSYRLPVAGYW